MINCSPKEVNITFTFNCTSTCFVDYGEKENADIAEKYGVKKDDFPVYKLFVKGKDEPVTYTGDVKNADDIKKFLIRESGNNWTLFSTVHFYFDTFTRICSNNDLNAF